MITTSFNSGAGQISLSFGTSHTSVATISQIGQLRYSFDQTPDTLSIDRVQALYTYINIDLLQYDDGGNDLWEVLISETNSATIQVTLEVVLPDGAFQFLFKIRKPDISLNERSGIVTLRLTPFTNFNTNMGTLFDSMYSDSVLFIRFLASALNDSGTRTTYRYNAFSPSSFISRSLNSVFSNDFDNVISSSDTDLGDDYTDKVFGGFENDKKQFAICDIRAGNPPSPTQQVGIGTPSEETDEGDGLLTGFGFYQPTGELPFRFKIVVDIPSDNGVVVGDDIYIGDSSLKEAGRRVGAVIELPSAGTDGRYIIQLNEDDPFPFSTDDSLPFKIARGNRPENELVIDVLKGMAGVEGSIFGSGFSKNWYINRLAEEEQGSANLVTINYNEAIEFRPFNFDLSLGRSVVGQVASYNSLGDDLFGQWGLKASSLINEDNEQIGSGVPNLGSFTSVTPGNSGATKGLDIQLAPAYPFLSKGIINPPLTNIIFGSKIVGETDEVIQDLALESALTRNGLKSYFQSLNASAGSIAVEFTVIGSQRVLPYELFQFDSRAPEKYRNKQFRITEVSYDLVNDTCKLKGYQISSVTTPTVDDPRPRIAPPRIPPSFVGDPIGKLERAVDDETVDSLRINFNNPSATGRSILILNDLEREQGYFQDNEAGQYEVTLNNGDVPNTADAQFVGTNISDIPQGSIFTQVVIRSILAIELTAGSTITITNIAGQSQTLTIATTITTTASTAWPSGGNNTIVQVNSATATHFYQGSYSYVHKTGYTAVPKRSTFPVGISEVPIQSSRINAPRGSLVYTSAPFDDEGIQIQQEFTKELNVRLIDTETNLVATSNSLLSLTSSVSNINGVVTAQGDFLVSLNSTVTNIETDVSGQSTAIFNLNTRVTAGEGYLISNASAITAIESRIDDNTTGLNASASAIDILRTNVSLIDDNLIATAERIDIIEVNVTTAEGSITAISEDVSNVNIEINTITGEVTNISAKRALVVNADGTVGEISLTADGLTGFSQIELKASQVKIQDVVFDADGAMYSGNFITGSPSGAITAGVITANGSLGWAMDKAGKSVFSNVTVRGGGSIVGTSEGPIMEMYIGDNPDTTPTAKRLTVVHDETVAPYTAVFDRQSTEPGRATMLVKHPGTSVNNKIAQFVSGVSGGDAFNVKANGSIESASYHDIRTGSEPASPASGTVRLFSQVVTGVGHTLKVKFPSGVVVTLATE